MVKIDNTSKTQKSALRRSAKSNEPAASSFLDSIDAQHGLDKLSSVSPISSTQVLLTLQETGDKQAAWVFGNRILDLLDAIRLELLSGELEDNQLRCLQQQLSTDASFVKEMEIKSVLEEIIQRANIELAKRGLI